LGQRKDLKPVLALWLIHLKAFYSIKRLDLFHQILDQALTIFLLKINLVVAVAVTTLIEAVEAAMAAMTNIEIEGHSL